MNPVIAPILASNEVARWLSETAETVDARASIPGRILGDADGLPRSGKHVFSLQAGENLAPDDIYGYASTDGPDSRNVRRASYPVGRDVRIDEAVLRDLARSEHCIGSGRPAFDRARMERGAMLLTTRSRHAENAAEVIARSSFGKVALKRVASGTGTSGSSGRMGWTTTR